MKSSEQDVVDIIACISVSAGHESVENLRLTCAGSFVKCDLRRLLEIAIGILGLYGDPAGEGGTVFIEHIIAALYHLQAGQRRSVDRVRFSAEAAGRDYTSLAVLP